MHVLLLILFATLATGCYQSRTVAVAFEDGVNMLCEKYDVDMRQPGVHRIFPVHKPGRVEQESELLSKEEKNKLRELYMEQRGLSEQEFEQLKQNKIKEFNEQVQAINALLINISTRKLVVKEYIPGERLYVHLYTYFIVYKRSYIVLESTADNKSLLSNDQFSSFCIFFSMERDAERQLLETLGTECESGDIKQRYQKRDAATSR